MDFEPIDLSWIRENDGTWNVDKIVAFGCVLAFGFAVAFAA